MIPHCFVHDVKEKNSFPTNCIKITETELARKRISGEK